MGSGRRTERNPGADTDTITDWLTPALLLGLFAWLRADLNNLRADLNNLHERIDGLQEAMAQLRERMAKLEGLREAIAGKRAD